MAEIYPPGQHRIFYRSHLFTEGRNVTVAMLRPDDVWDDEIDLEELGKGLYRFEANFNQEGTWVGMFYENGTCAVSQNFLVMKLPRPRITGCNILNG